ncbi:hypothetical protein [Alteromonas naphthalenivorans]|uniref:Uncharacterized protein n=1 Tax=Alteromonas naphthalenivorans TaxID=715451 RepID=F5ZFY4_ALTNA|nr:hypothetical protein [Alteromonas naphthalenivorans]AEF05752.1 hypothetical protein ambt_21305 [Alteromonas naphthalenivorans]
MNDHIINTVIATMKSPTAQNMLKTFRALIILSLLASNCTFSNNLNKQYVKRYEIYSENDHIGFANISLTQLSSEKIAFEQSYDLKTESWLEDSRVSSIVNEVFSSDLRLLHANEKKQINGVIYLKKLELLGQEYFTFCSEAKTAEEKGSDEVEQIIGDLSVLMIPGLGEAFSLGSTFFASVQECQSPALQTISKFDTTLMHLPIWLKQQNGVPSQVTIYDIEAQRPINYKITKLPQSENFDSDSEELLKIQLSTENRPPLQVFIDEKSEEFPFLVQVSGEDDDGSFMISLSSTKRN